MVVEERGPTRTISRGTEALLLASPRRVAWGDEKRPVTRSRSRAFASHLSSPYEPNTVLWNGPENRNCEQIREA
mgnify:FL=1